MNKRYALILTASRCGDRSTCWHGSCGCGKWTKGPHFMPETVRAYWADHVHLEHESQCPIHGIDEVTA